MTESQDDESRPETDDRSAGAEGVRDSDRRPTPAVRGIDDLVRSSAPLHLGDGGGALPSAPIISLVRATQPPGMRLPMPGAGWRPRG